MKWMLIVVMASVGLACASADRSSYRQGIYLPPPEAPAFDPTTDSPITTGHPGYGPGRQPLPPSPSLRLLPPTREAAVYAADKDAHPTTDQLFGFVYPLHQEGVPKAAHAEEACARKVADKLAEHQVSEDRRVVDPRMLRCLAAKLWAGCVFPGTKEGNPIDPSLWDRLKVIQSSVTLVMKNCPDDLLDKHGPAIQELVAELHRGW